MTELFLEVETKDPSLGFRIFDSTHLSTGETEIQIYEGITAKYNGTIVRLAVDFPSILQIVIEISKEFVIEIASGLIAAWLYEKLKGKDVKKYELIGVR